MISRQENTDKRLFELCVLFKHYLLVEDIIVTRYLNNLN